MNSGNSLHDSFFAYFLFLSFCYLSLQVSTSAPCFYDYVSMNFIMFFNFRKRRDKSINCSHNSLGTTQKLSCYNAGADFSYFHKTWLHPFYIQYVQSRTLFLFLFIKFSVYLSIHLIRSCFKLLIYMLLEGIHSLSFQMPLDMVSLNYVLGIQIQSTIELVLISVSCLSDFLYDPFVESHHKQEGTPGPDCAL